MAWPPRWRSRICRASADGAEHWPQRLVFYIRYQAGSEVSCSPQGPGRAALRGIPFGGHATAIVPSEGEVVVEPDGLVSGIARGSGVSEGEWQDGPQRDLLTPPGSSLVTGLDPGGLVHAESRGSARSAIT